jgi:16S rRNA (adenine1518-N6/adenine1519-N6)-dimethyltransferase
VTHSARDLRDLLDRHGLSPSRALGQNFVADPNTVRRIARLAGVGPDDHVIEIGAGLGSLTLALAETGAPVTAVERDRHVVPVLREIVEPAGVTVVEDDAMTADWATLLAGAPRWVLVANLPYNIATPLVLDLLDEVPAIGRMLVMVQLEVAERLAAAPGSRVYGLPSLKVAYWATASLAGRVPRTVFVPPPRVDSALVRIERRATPTGPGPNAQSGLRGPNAQSGLRGPNAQSGLRGPNAQSGAAEHRERLFALARQAFAQRRKMLRRSLAGTVDAAAFAAAGISPEARPEQLGVDDWGRLAGVLTAAPGRVT